MDWSEFTSRIEHIHKNLDRLTYYDLLNVRPDAPVAQIRDAYHRMALNMHPDRYHDSPDQLRTYIYAIYKRIAEGYRVLMNAKLRQEYDQLIPTGVVRLVKTERKKTGPTRLEDAITHPQAKKFFLLGLTAEREGDKKAARMNYKFAINLIGEHPVLLNRLAEVES